MLMAVKIYGEFGWKVYKFVNCNPALRCKENTIGGGRNDESIFSRLLPNISDISKPSQDGDSLHCKK
jgi:hypothetical protein